MNVLPKPILPVEVPRAGAAIPEWARLGVLFGLLSAASILLWGPIGVSSTYPRLVGAALRWLAPGWAGANSYLVKMGELAKPESFLVLGLLIGGFVASRSSRQPAPSPAAIHPGETSRVLRYRDAFLGGFLIIFGARLAGGCTSGHIISGITQLSLSGMVFAAGVFATGILTARLLQRGGR